MSESLLSSLIIIILLLTICSTSIESNEHYLHRLDRAAYNGDVGKVDKLAALQLNWNQLYNDKKSSVTAIHHALRGRHDSLAIQSLQLLGNHETVIDHLVNKAFLNPTLGCPLYHSIHYRNTRALQLLLKTSNKNDVLECLTTQDVNGETALHSAPSSKASGFARFYAKLLTNGSQLLQQSTENVLQLLDLKYNKLFQLEYLSFKDLTAAIGHRDIEMILQQLKEDFCCNCILDKHHNTILHIAAASGRLELVRTLITAGCSVNQHNMYGQTPIDMAANADHQQIVLELMQSQHTLQTDVFFKEIEKCKNHHTNVFVDIVSTRHCKLSDFGMNQYLTSGWNSDYYYYYYSRKIKCDIEHVHAINMENFQHYYYSRKNPIVFKGISLEWPAWKHWRRDEFIRRYGNISVMLNDIPYAGLYGYQQNRFTESITVSEFIKNFDNLSTYRYPPYLFDAHVLQRYSKLAADVPVPSMLSNFSISLNQFILGPKGSGSPPHFHRDTVNGLVYGIKHWYLWPPREAFFSIQHIQDWIHQYSHYGNYSDPIECIQLPGDVLYIPDNWGHAVINEEHSIGFAYEFS